MTTKVGISILGFRSNVNWIFVANTTGLRSIYTTHQGFEIMFHVATMLTITR